MVTATPAAENHKSEFHVKRSGTGRFRATESHPKQKTDAQDFLKYGPFWINKFTL